MKEQKQAQETVPSEIFEKAPPVPAGDLGHRPPDLFSVPDENRDRGVLGLDVEPDDA